VSVKLGLRKLIVIHYIQLTGKKQTKFELNISKTNKIIIY